MAKCQSSTIDLYLNQSFIYVVTLIVHYHNLLLNVWVIQKLELSPMQFINMRTVENQLDAFLFR